MFWFFFYIFTNTEEASIIWGKLFFFYGHPLPEIKDKKISTYVLECLNNTEIELLQ